MVPDICPTYVCLGCKIYKLDTGLAIDHELRSNDKLCGFLRSGEGLQESVCLSCFGIWITLLCLSQPLLLIWGNFVFW